MIAISISSEYLSVTPNAKKPFEHVQIFEMRKSSTIATERNRELRRGLYGYMGERSVNCYSFKNSNYCLLFSSTIICNFAKLKNDKTSSFSTKESSSYEFFRRSIEIIKSENLNPFVFDKTISGAGCYRGLNGIQLTISKLGGKSLRNQGLSPNFLTHSGTLFVLLRTKIFRNSLEKTPPLL